MTTEEFIEKARNTHGDRYDYSSTVYVRSIDKVSIVCKIHGEFKQRVGDHLRGSGCSKCGTVTTASKKTGVPSPLRNTQEQFINKSNNRHGHKYDYTKVVFENMSTVVDIVCPTHGVFKQRASDHLAGCGCSECHKDKARDRYTSNTTTFIEKANDVHNGKYTYSKTNYINAKTKVTITCPEHGDFEQTPNDHLNGCGCRVCRTENIGWTDTKWKAQAQQSKVFEGFKVYIVKIFDADESFIKIGKTFTSMNYRMREISRMYNYVVLDVIEADADTVCKLERKYLRANRDNKYKPCVEFSGHTECFTKVIIKGKEYK